MASRRSRSPSTPSEGEIVESGSETKATTSQTSVIDTNVNRHARLSPSFSPRSPPSGARSPYRRGEKRRRYDYDDDDRSYSHSSHRYESRSDHDRRYDSRRHRTYRDYDRDDSYSGALRYTDDYDRRDKRQKTRSRSPFQDVRKPKKYDDTDGNEPRKVAFVEQSVSERGSPIVVAQDVKPQAERERQVHESSTDTSPSILNG
jgi:serine/threonine-protein kinase PRP4